jgi:hypothetical protein
MAGISSKVGWWGSRWKVGSFYADIALRWKTPDLAIASTGGGSGVRFKIGSRRSTASLPQTPHLSGLEFEIVTQFSQKTACAKGML